MAKPMPLVLQPVIKTVFFNTVAIIVVIIGVKGGNMSSQAE